MASGARWRWPLPERASEWPWLAAGARRADPQAYAEDARLHEGLAHLRAQAPVCHVDVENYAPFWAITKHADIMEIERANDIFTNSPRPGGAM